MIPGYPEPLPPVGYQAENPCAPAGGAGGGFGRFGGGGNQGPMVPPGVYQVALVIDGKSVDRKSLEIVMDPVVRMTAAERTAYQATAMEWHAAQQRGADVAASLNALQAEVRRAAARIDSTPALADSVKTAFAAFRKEFDAVRGKFGVGVPAAPGFGGGGGFGGGANDANVLARVATAKGNLLAVWEAPSAALTAQGQAAKAALETAMAEVTPVLARARTVGAQLAAAGIPFKAP